MTTARVEVLVEERLGESSRAPHDEGPGVEADPVADTDLVPDWRLVRMLEVRAGAALREQILERGVGFFVSAIHPLDTVAPAWRSGQVEPTARTFRTRID